MSLLILVYASIGKWPQQANLLGEAILGLTKSPEGETGIRWGPYPAYVTITFPWLSRTYNTLSANIGSNFILC